MLAVGGGRVNGCVPEDRFGPAMAPFRAGHRRLENGEQSGRHPATAFVSLRVTSAHRRTIFILGGTLSEGPTEFAHKTHGGGSTVALGRVLEE